MAEKSETLVTKEEKINEAKELFGRGSRNYCMKQYADAADDLSACCSIYSELYGPNAVECGLPYLMYAKSLIAIGKDENNLIVPGDDEEEADDDDDDDEENGEEEGADGDEKEEHEEKQDEDEEMDTKESSTDAKDSTVAEKENGIEEKKEESDPSKVEVATEAAAGSSSSDAKAVATNGEPTPGPSTSNGDTSVQEETPDNLQVAWEILELAVHIFQEQGEKGYENLPECYVELAGISFENSFFKDAINDYGKALEIYKKTNQSDQRLLAEVNYKVGLCHMMEREFEESIISFKGAITELDKVVETEKAKEQTDDTKEIIEDIEQLKKEILDKITDVEEAMKTPIEDVKRELSKIIVSGGGESSSKDLNNGASSSSSGATNGSAAKSSSAATKPANDISHLIKRKKPDSATTEVEGSPAKKTASE
ncbi:protein NASP homolog [Anopheles nili]|uniref:protein NASP homolog n=1 Tax=Anopheles nili TaxID=185578 RepID=UPI00237C40EC|nr:protein NASP homolog [Anopheles nili]